MAEEPVEIDIILRQNVDTEANKASDAITRLAAESSRAQEDASRMISVQRDVVSRLKSEIESLQKAFSNISINTNDEKSVKWRQDTYQQIRALNIELSKQEGILADLESRNNTLGESKTKLIGDIEAVATAMSNLSKTGKTESEQYKELEAQLETMSDGYMAMKEEQDKITGARVDFEAFSGALDNVSDSVRSAGGQFGDASGKASEFTNVLETAGRAQAIVKSGQNAVNDEVDKTKKRTREASEETRRWSALNQFLARTFNISNAAAQRLIATMSLGLGIAIGAVTKLIQKQIDKLQESKREQEEFNKSVASNAASQIANYEKLRISYNKLGDDIKAKEKFILDNQGAFRQLGVSINDVNAADNLFISQTGAFRSAIEQRARAAAAMDMAAEKYRSAMEKQEKADKREREPNAWEQLTSVSAFYQRGDQRVLRNPGAVIAADKIRKEAEKEEKSAQSYVNKYISAEQNATEQIKNANIENAEKLTEGTKAWWEAKKKNTQAKLDAMKNTQKGSDEWNALADEIRQADNTIKSFDITGSDKRDASAEKKADAERKKAFAAAEKIKKWGVDIQNDIDAAVVAAMEEGREKKLAELKSDYDKRVALIEQRRHEIEILEKETGANGSEQKNMLTALESSETAKYEAQIKVITEGSQKAMAEVWNEINSRFRTENENRLNEIDLFYAEQSKKARENGATQMELDQITADHKRDIELEKQHIALETLDFEEQIALKKAQIEDRRVMLQTDREEKMLRVQVQAAKKRLQKLKEIQSNGGDTAKEIEAVTAEIEVMNAELDRMPLRKFQELAGYAQQVLDGIGNFAANFDEDLGGLFDIASGAVGGIAGIASGNPAQMIQGSMQLLDVAGKIIQANRQANEDIRKFNLSMAQQAIDYSLAVIRAIKDIKSETDSIFTSNYTNTLTQGMAGYNAAIDKQAELMRKLSAETVKTGVEKKKFLGITYGTRDVYGNLLKQYPDLIKKDGTLNRELAESIKKSGNLKDETADLIDNILQASDAANEAMQSVESELQNLVGSIGSELKKALDDAFSSGTDSAKAMTDNVVKMLKDLSTQKLYNAVFGGLFSELEKRMKESYGATGDHDLTDDIDWFMKNYPDLVDSYNKGLSELQKKIQERYGVDAFATDDGRKAVNKGIAQASQDSIDEFNGRLTFLVMKVSDIGSINAMYVDLGREQLLVQRAMLGNLEVIAENSEFLKKLNGIADDIAKMNRDGIILKI